MSSIKEILADKEIKPKEKPAVLASLIAQGKVKLAEFVVESSASKDAGRGAIMEALEFASRENPKILDKKTFDFVVEGLSDTAPRVRWEAAKVIANTAANHVSQLDNALSALFRNTNDEKTVPRWAAATALAAIYKLGTQHNTSLTSKLEALAKNEESASIKKIYLAVLKAAKK